MVFVEVVLELDDGVEALLKHGDGTRLSWRNRFAEKCVVASEISGGHMACTEI